MRRVVAALVGRETRVSGSEGPDVRDVRVVRSADAGGWEIQRRLTVLQGDGGYRRAVTSSWHVGLPYG